MSDHLGMFEPQPPNDGRKSFYSKASVERRSTENGMRHALEPYGTVVAEVTPIGAWDTGQEVFRVEVGLERLSVTTPRHVKEFPARTDDVFKGITSPWPRKAIKGDITVRLVPPADHIVHIGTPAVTAIIRKDATDTETMNATASSTDQP